jgi:hypothetical protein
MQDVLESRRATAWSLRCQGKPFREIAKEIGISGSAAHRHVQKAREAALRRMTSDVAAHLIEREEQYLMLFRSAWERWEHTGDVELYDRAIATLDKITALWQISAPALHVHAQQAIVGQVNGARNLGGLKRMLAELRAPAAIEAKTVVEASQVIEVEPAAE